MLAGISWNEGTLAVLLIFGSGLAAVIGTFWYYIARMQAEMDLKQSMIDRGMSPADIERVLAAHGKD